MGSIYVSIYLSGLQQMLSSRGRLTHVVQGSDGGTELLEEERVEGLSAAKVDDLDGVHVGDDDVVGLDVQVQDPPGVQVVQTLQDLHHIGHHVVLRVAEP